jgi:XTP/dITP diphosphohydrolase
MKLVVATNNQGKLREIREILAGTGIEPVSLTEAGVSGDVDEDQDTFEGNAKKKAAHFAELTGMPTIGDDSGLCVDALDGAPGVYSARFSGEGATDAKNNLLLREKLLDVPDEKRTAHFACAMACVKPGGESIVAMGASEGVILRESRGDNGFGYDPLFYVPNLDKTFAELTGAEKHSISHRGRALRALVEKLPEFLEEN